jgi:hypothetical protein
VRPSPPGRVAGAPLVPTTEPHRLALVDTFEKIKTAKARQDSFQASRQEATQDLNTLLDKGRDEAIRLRGILRAELGPRSERLVHFGVAPLRKRTRRTKPPEDDPPLAKPAPTTE